MPQPAPDRSPTSVRIVGALWGAALGGGLFGTADALTTIFSGTLAPSRARQGVLMGVDCGLMALIGALAVLPLLLAFRFRGRILERSPMWWGFPLGVAAVALLDIGERWFRAPPPFTEAPPLHGDPLVFAAIVAGVACLAAGAVRWTPAGGVRALVVMALSVLGSVNVLVNARELPPRGSAAPDAPNLLLVTMDTARSDYFSPYGAPTDRTPHLTALASEGVTFNTAVAQIPVTGPSHTTLMTGQGPWEHGNLLNGVPIDPSLTLLSERLRDAGYQAGGFVSAYVLDGELGFARGFEVYDDDFDWLQGWSGTLPGRLISMLGRFLNPDHVLERRGSRTVDAALKFLERASPSAPFFLWVHLFDPHGPYLPPPPFDTQFYDGDPRDPSHASMNDVTDVAPYLRASLEGITDVDWVLAQYAGEVSFADAQLGRLLEWLESSGHTSDTVVIAVADHGESLGEHGVWFNHGEDLFDVSTHVPLVIRAPGHLEAGTALDCPVELTDLTPTMLELLGVPVPDSVSGTSVLAAIGGGRCRPHARSICFDRQANVRARQRGEIERPVFRMVSLRGQSSRFVWREAPGYGEAFYDLTTDPAETTPTHTDDYILDTLRAEAERIANVMSADDMERTNQELDAETQQKLAELGYMD